MKEKLNIFKSQSKVAWQNREKYISQAKVKLKTFHLKDLKPKNIKNSPFIVLGVAILIVFLGSIFMARGFINQSSSVTGDGDRIAPPVALASQDINTSFEFPIRDANNEEVAQVRYEIEKASLQNSFIYQGKLAKSVQGRTFLVFDLKIKNPFEKGIEINTVDYIRIKRNGGDEQLAPEIHNDPVQIQANSTKFTRIGIPINESDEDLIIIVGEIEGDKEEVKLNF